MRDRLVVFLLILIAVHMAEGRRDPFGIIALHVDGTPDETAAVARLRLAITNGSIMFPWTAYIARKTRDNVMPWTAYIARKISDNVDVELFFAGLFAVAVGPIVEEFSFRFIIRRGLCVVICRLEDDGSAKLIVDVMVSVLFGAFHLVGDAPKDSPFYMDSVDRRFQAVVTGLLSLLILCPVADRDGWLAAFVRHACWNCMPFASLCYCRASGFANPSAFKSARERMSWKQRVHAYIAEWAVRALLVVLVIVMRVERSS